MAQRYVVSITIFYLAVRISDRCLSVSRFILSGFHDKENRGRRGPESEEGRIGSECAIVSLIDFFFAPISLIESSRPWGFENHFLCHPSLSMSTNHFLKTSFLTISCFILLWQTLPDSVTFPPFPEVIVISDDEESVSIFLLLMFARELFPPKNVWLVRKY